MKTIILILSLAFCHSVDAQHFGTIHPDGSITNDEDRPRQREPNRPHQPSPPQYTMKIRPCGDGTHGTRPCAIPLTDCIPYLIMTAACLGIAKLRSR